MSDKTETTHETICLDEKVDFIETTFGIPMVYAFETTIVDKDTGNVGKGIADSQSKADQIARDDFRGKNDRS